MSRNGEAAQKRQVILQKAQKLFEEDGFDGTTMQDIARACRFEAGNLYHYFKSKEHILYEIYLEYNKRAMPPLIELEHSGSLRPEERLREFVKCHVRFELGDVGPCVNLFETEIRHLAPAHRRRFLRDRGVYMSILTTIINDCVRSGYFREVDPKLSALCIVAIIMRARLWYSPSGKLTIDQLSDFITDMSTNGLRAHDAERKPETTPAGATSAAVAGR